MAATRGGKSPNPSRPKPKPKPKKLHNRDRLITAAATATASAHKFLLNHDLRLLPHQTLSLHTHLTSLSASLHIPLNLSSSYFHRLLSDSNSDRFPQFFRISKNSFQILLSILSPHLSHLPFPASAALAATLFRLAHSASYESLSLLFDLTSPSSACLAFFTVLKAILDNLSNYFELKSDVSRVVVGFGWISLPNCSGVIGFGRFPVRRGGLLGENGALLVQAVVDSEGRFLDVSAGWPSTMKPDKILRQSKLFAGVEAGEYLSGDKYEINDGSSVRQYFLGDSCFPLLPWLITPYREAQREMEVEFNSVHKKGMDLVDTAFGRVKETWKIVSGEWREECIEYFPYVVTACCLLHNYLIKSRLASEDFQFLEEDVEYENGQKLIRFQGEEDCEGVRIRDALALHLNRVRLTD